VEDQEWKMGTEVGGMMVKSVGTMPMEEMMRVMMEE
jgi:hypothetical protein